ncbi:MAG: carbamoyltransferase HypF [Candidatus Omnitrophica bacterium]|nr:carbamoyltransferase HypF [Candidatus Omnitrophota bacterium]
MRDILALGAEGKCAFSVLTNDGLYHGEPFGSLREAATLFAYETAIHAYLKQNKIKPDLIVCDMHPDYSSTHLAEKLQKEYKNSELVKIQHHQAHIAGAMWDNGLLEKVIGVAFDGTGYGTDGKSWGGEFMFADTGKFDRRFHLEYVPVPGGDAAAKEIWRMGAAYLIGAFGDGFVTKNRRFRERIGAKKVDMLKQMINKGINSPGSSGAGRLFDAVASILGICDEAAFEAEGAIMLEKKADAGIGEFYEFEIKELEISVEPMIRQIVDDIDKKLAPGVISAKFHNTVGEVIFAAASAMHEESGLGKVVISGGCFQNKYLVNYLEKRFNGSEMELFKHKKFSTTDIGVSVGQAIVAASI